MAEQPALLFRRCGSDATHFGGMGAAQSAPAPRGGLVRLDIARIDVASEEDEETVVFVHEALERLAAKDPLCAELIALRFFASVPNHQAARLLGLSERTAKRNWAYARAWLAKEIERFKAATES